MGLTSYNARKWYCYSQTISVCGTLHLQLLKNNIRQCMWRNWKSPISQGRFRWFPNLLLCLPLGVAFICIIHINYRGRGSGVVGAWSPGTTGEAPVWWRLCLASDFLTEAYFGIGGRGRENVLFRCVYICTGIIMSFDAWL